MLGKLWIGLLCLASALLAPAGALAAAGTTGGGVLFQLAGTHGYSILVLGGEKPGASAGAAIVLVTKQHTATTYAVPATVTESSFEADLGPYGHISLRPEPTGVQRTAPEDCGGKPAAYEGVDYVGDFEFRGEGGYTSARAESLPLRLDLASGLVCGDLVTEETLGGPGLPGAVLVARSGGAPGKLTISAKTNGPGRPVRLRAVLDESRRRIKVEREVSGVFNAGTIEYDPTLRTAVLAPSAPFSGSAHFARDAARANRWTGNLRVDFAGRPQTSLTGRRFAIRLIHGEWRREVGFDRAGAFRPNLSPWPSTKPWPTAFATPSPLGPS